MTPSTRTSKRPPDALSLLKKDHAAMKKLLRLLEKTKSSSDNRRKQLFGQVSAEIEVHAQIEEEIFYPAFRKRAKTDEDEKLFHEAHAEHALVHRAIPELRRTDPKSELFSARAKVLMDLVEHHAEEEEDELFPRARKLFDGAELTELGGQLQARKADLLRKAPRKR